MFHRPRSGVCCAARRSPLLAGCLAVFILSLAGIPPLAGFFGKFFVFAAALQLAAAEGVTLACGLATLELFEPPLSKALPAPRHGTLPLI